MYLNDMKEILLVEDDIVFATLLQKYLERNNYNTTNAKTIKEAKQILDQKKIDLVLLDYHLPDGNGMQCLEWIKARHANIEVLFMTSIVDIKIAVQAIKKGALDYITKPINQEELLMQINSMQQNNKTNNKNKQQIYNTSDNYVKGHSASMQSVYSYVESVAPTNLNVLIVGETGTGKEHIAKMIHEKSHRANKPFVAVDCGVLFAELASSELFGHVKGSFTGALQDKVGQFELANGGTIFLDEIGNLPYDVQIKLLRAIQEKTIVRLGANEPRKIDARIIAATNEDFLTAIQQNSFREDLYHRINEFQIKIPALRNRLEDLELLVHYFIEKSNQEFTKNIVASDETLLKFFKEYHWPGNIRELQNVVRRAVLLCKESSISLNDLPIEMTQIPTKNINENIEPSIHNISIKDAREEQEKTLIIQALISTKFNKTKAAKLLKIDRSTLYAKMEKYNITDT